MENCFNNRISMLAMVPTNSIFLGRSYQNIIIGSTTTGYLFMDGSHDNKIVGHMGPILDSAGYNNTIT